MAPLRIVRRYFFGHHPPLDENERRLVLRAVVATATPLAVITTFILIVGGAFAVNELRDRTNENRQAIRAAEQAARDARALAEQLNIERANRENALAWQVYDECVENENQDATNAALFRQVRTVMLQSPPNPARDALLEGLSEAIDAREPEGEKDCEVPLRPRPERAP